jgi:flagellar biosynthesis/type III secretory pathway protein FliH
MSRNIIDRERFVFNDDTSSKRLSYRTIFGEEPENQADDATSVEERYIKELNQLRRTMQAEVEKAREDGFRRGHDTGFREGFDQASTDIDRRVTQIERALKEASREWRAIQEELHPGVLKMIFEICESVLGIPFEDHDIRKKMESELMVLFQELDGASKPVLWVHEGDLAFAGDLISRYAKRIGIQVRPAEKCKPGEYVLETNKERIIRDYQLMLREFVENMGPLR